MKTKKTCMYVYMYTYIHAYSYSVCVRVFLAPSGNSVGIDGPYSQAAD